MSAALLLLLVLAPPLFISIAGCAVHDIRWHYKCNAANARYATKRAQWQKEAAWEAEKAAAIQAVAERNYAVARRGGTVMVFEAIPEQYR